MCTILKRKKEKKSNPLTNPPSQAPLKLFWGKSLWGNNKQEKEYLEKKPTKSETLHNLKLGKSISLLTRDILLMSNCTEPRKIRPPNWMCYLQSMFREQICKTVSFLKNTGDPKMNSRNELQTERPSNLKSPRNSARTSSNHIHPYIESLFNHMEVQKWSLAHSKAFITTRISASKAQTSPKGTEKQPFTKPLLFLKIPLPPNTCKPH